MSPLEFMVFILVLAQIIALIGYGQFYPGLIPAFINGISGVTNPDIEGTGIFIVFLVSVLGITSTMFWWKYAGKDQ